MNGINTNNVTIHFHCSNQKSNDESELQPSKSPTTYQAFNHPTPVIQKYNDKLHP